MTGNQNVSGPSAQLKPLNKLVGSWKLEHKDLNTGEEWGGDDTFEWLPGGHFMAYHHEEDKGVKGVMILGYEKGWEETELGKELVGHWFESSSAHHYVYIWEVDDHTLQFWLNDKQSSMSFKGEFSEDGTTITGTWKWPVGGYNLVMKRTMTENLNALNQKHVEYIVELRDAAYHYDWLKCEQVSKKLFRLLTLDNVIHVVLHQLITHLPIFERFHPDVKWPRVFLLQFIGIQSKDKIFDFPFYREIYSSPGSDGFIHALGFLADIEKSRNKPDRYTFDLAVDAIALTVHSKRLALWAIEHPDEWDLWIKADGKPVKIRSMGIEALTIQEAARDSWLNVTFEISKSVGIKP